ncbi:ketopantoate reductase family protein [Kineococcus rhizosphaerae]|uniref:2-dehydropantoate 2-reductase n=1 Tax=Kineococcus rhizosphaerae TaxID=559628 RepID=A0A2T0R1B7_9ACTN|nr:2-dehydropantoate 2-reductase N-terminal domain-containing protein [Kineococcus rhizosphaerae]PRY13069.1 2-dehydropantoate 2-reductase [Kineococcus rhizosphaerae]
MTWTIVGAGAIGGTLAHALARDGHEVVVVDADRDHVDALRGKGITIRRADGRDDTVEVARAVHPDDAQDLRDLQKVVIATKSQHTVQAATWTASRLAPGGFVVSAQNGVNEPVIADHVGTHRVLGAFVNIFADYLEPGVVRDGGLGALAVGLPGSGAPDLRVLETAEDLRAYGDVVVTANLEGYRASKAGFGAVLGVTTLVDAPMADVVEAYPDVASAAAAEKVEASIAAGLVLEPFDAWEPYGFRALASERVRTAATARLVAWLRTMPKDRSGVFRDIAVRRRPRETHPLGYAPAVRGPAPTPVNDAVAARLDDVAAGHAEFGTHHLDALRRLLP